MKKNLFWIIPVFVALAIAIPAFLIFPMKSGEIHFVGKQDDMAGMHHDMPGMQYEAGTHQP